MIKHVIKQPKFLCRNNNQKFSPSHFPTTDLFNMYIYFLLYSTVNQYWLQSCYFVVGAVLVV